MNRNPVVDAIERGRASYANRAWLDAYDSLALADEAEPLDADDLELLAMSAYMLGRDDDYVRGLERAHHGYLDAGEVPSAARCTWWIGLNLLMRGESSRATGWFGRGDRLLEREARDCVERGYLLMPVMLRAFAKGDAETADAIAAEAAAIGERFGDRDLVTIARMEQGHALVLQGRAERGVSPRGRDHGRRHDGRVVADRRRHRLLQHDRVLSETRTRCAARASGPTP